MKRTITLLMAVVMVLSMALTLIACGGDDTTTTTTTTTTSATTTTTKKGRPGIVLEKDYEGEGTEESPYLIDDVKSLQAMAKNADLSKGFQGKFFKLTDNIDMLDQEWVPLTSFNGVFDGDGYAILNLTAEGTAINYSTAGKKVGGFCGELNGVIKNVAFLNLTVNVKSAGGQTHAGMLVGKMLGSAEVRNVFIHGYANATGVDAGTSAGDLRFGTVAGYNDSAPIFENVVCSVSLQGVGSVYRLAGGGGTFTITDTYIIFNDCSTTANGWISSGAFKPYDSENENGTTNFYCTGATAAGIVYNGAATYAELGAAGFYDGKTAATTAADFYGDACGFNAENWLTFDDSAPVQKVFEGKCSDTLKDLVK